MTKEDAIKFIKDLFTLRTVWIDKGSGRWAVKKRFHPLLRSAFWVLAVVFCAGIYSAVNNPNHSEAIAGAAEEPKTVATLPEPDEMKLAPPVRKELVIPLADSPKPTKQNKQEVPKEAPKRRAASKRNDVVLPSERNPSAGRIISPSANLKPEPAQEPQKPAPKKLPAGRITDKTRYSVGVNKSTYTLTLYRDGEIVKEYPIAVGKNPGDKQRVGDNRTPTGNFKVVSIENASTWTHDFRDGKGKIKGAYGPWFLRLDAKGWKGIGIHGTHDPDSRGTNATEGCIRLSNEDIAELKQYAYKNMPVTIREY